LLKGIVIVSVKHPDGNVHQVAVRSDTRLQDLHSALAEAGRSKDISTSLSFRTGAKGKILIYSVRSSR
jgi:hypothetical protein